MKLPEIKTLSDIERLYHAEDCQCEPCKQETKEGEKMTGETIARYQDDACGGLIREEPFNELEFLATLKTIERFCQDHMQRKGGTYAEALEICWRGNPEYKAIYARKPKT